MIADSVMILPSRLKWFTQAFPFELKTTIFVGVHALNDWKNEFLRVIDIRIDNFTKHPHLYKQPPSRSVKSLKKKMEKLHRKYVFAPADKAANNVIII